MAAFCLSSCLPSAHYSSEYESFSRSEKSSCNNTYRKRFARSFAGNAFEFTPRRRNRSLCFKLLTFASVETQAETKTEKFLSKISLQTLAGLRAADKVWARVKTGTGTPKQVVQEEAFLLGEAPEFDVIICGGTLGIFLGAALALLGHKVAVVERGVLRGRDQEWNISRRELGVFTELGLLSDEELNQALVTEYNPARVGFKGGKDIWVKDILNTGVDPVYLLDRLKAKFLECGGTLLENTPFEGATVHPDGVEVALGEKKRTTRLLIDAMGNMSPMVAQSRNGAKPDSVCAVVGSCAKGFPSNETGDLIYSFTPIENDLQLFWEAFPARDGRTTYMFTYIDADPQRPSLEQMYEDYLRYLPEYQGVDIEDLEPVRALFGFFPCYKNSPLKCKWDRIQHVGDSSGNQSPLSFGGFGSMVRHLSRLQNGISEALDSGNLSKESLSLLQPYQPNLSVTWLFQRAMSARVGQGLPPSQVNDVLKVVFNEMGNLGDDVLRPFLQDVVQFPALTRTMVAMSLADPILVMKVMAQVGPAALVDWTAHYAALGLYSVSRPLADGIAGATNSYPVKRFAEALKFGTGGDYHA